MTVAEYAEKYGITVKSVYHAVYAGRIPYARHDGRLDLEDIQMTNHPRFRTPDELTELPDYILALIWFCGTISGDAILVRHKNPEIPETVSRFIRSSIWRREGYRSQTVCKINSPVICRALRDLGFSGKKDLDRTPPPVGEIAFAKAFFEAHTNFGYALHYDRRHPMDKDHAYYTPRVRFCASPAIIEQFALALAALDIAPVKLPATAANGKSAIYQITSRAQMQAASRVLGPDLDGLGSREFWDRFDAHASAKTIPYDEYHNR